MAELRYGNNMESVPSTPRQTLSSGCAQQVCRAAFKTTAARFSWELLWCCERAAQGGVKRPYTTQIMRTIKSQLTLFGLI